ncbi:MAG: Flp pilus assembly protein CpaD [uncultured Sphingomonadaceae bacterium]|uniref:Flp pilus assembly protein CpaD n=1 Tax=uncultured Sphingomonadaceae bacterium TaxID=169976 RepID=A0A6J4RNR2_9SPHN|nr:MAG: Flp pilus assembly protein CpaD [uncultured Sphingomonadaceae bacterium]
MKTPKLPLVLLGACALLAGCGGGPRRGLESVNQPVVSRTDYVLDVGAGGGDRLPTAEAARLRNWFDSLRLSYGDRVAVSDPSGDGAGRATVAQIAADYGLLLSDAAPVTAGEVAPGALRVVVTRTAATVPGCPDWSDGGRSADERSSRDYGCAVNGNLAAMIADPEDLVRGRTGDPAVDARTATKAVDAYRKSAPTGAQGLKSESTGGKQ